MIDQALIELLRPLVREVVRDELRREREQWRWATVEQAAERLGVSPRAIYSRVERGHLSAKRIGRRLFVDMAALDTQLDLLPSTETTTERPRRRLSPPRGPDTRR